MVSHVPLSVSRYIALSQGFELIPFVSQELFRPVVSGTPVRDYSSWNHGPVLG